MASRHDDLPYLSKETYHTSFQGVTITRWFSLFVLLYIVFNEWVVLGFGQAFIAFLQQGEIVWFFLKEMLIFVRTHEEYDSSVAITADKQM